MAERTVPSGEPTWVRNDGRSGRFLRPLPPNAMSAANSTWRALSAGASRSVLLVLAASGEPARAGRREPTFSINPRNGVHR